MSSDEISQYVDQVLSFSSEFGAENWSARNLKGPPTCNNVYGDSQTTWCPARYSQEEFIEVRFERSVYVTKIRIYENLNGGSVVKIEGLSCPGTYETIWSRIEPEHITTYRVFEPVFEKTFYRTNQIKLTLRCTVANYFSEIDAIELVGNLSNVSIPPESLMNDISRLLLDYKFSDVKICFDEGALMAHRNIINVRCPSLFEYLDGNSFVLKEVDIHQFRVILDFIYTDRLNEAFVKNVLNFEEDERKALIGDVSVADTIVEDFDKISLITGTQRLNNLIRFVARFQITRLESLLLNFLYCRHFSKENILDFLLDSLNLTNGKLLVGNDFSLKSNKMPLEKVEHLCLEFIKQNLHGLVNMEKFQMLPKSVLIRIIKKAI